MPTISPCLWFDDQAEEAMNVHTAVFENARRGETARYPPGVAPDQEGTIMFADFTLDGQWFAGMDRAQEHDSSFDEGTSLLCADQDESITTGTPSPPTAARRRRVAG